MSIDTALYTRLSGFAGLSKLVSTRIYPIRMPQNATFPLVCYQQVGATRDYVMQNQSGLVQTLYQIDCYDSTLEDARAVAEQARLALSNYSGTSDSVEIDWTAMEGEEALYEPAVDLYRMMQFYRLHFRETPP